MRGQLLIQPSVDLRVRLSDDFTNFESNCCTQVYSRVEQSLRPASRQYPALAAAFGYSLPSTNPYGRVTDINAALGVRGLMLQRRWSGTMLAKRLAGFMQASGKKVRLMHQHNLQTKVSSLVVWSSVG